ncbi:Anti-sigma regulatory factor (Ser/Thr protein kinase) [Streptomyces prasinopilosus]|uniref:Anti-sigma regulatory factor (Ser/Thr protein kinase) n=2 Tax=Streptomyces prasinopilosus TaxID=67344 RepID=A0A1G6QW73_9ACTN|nr:Anti-sigma regulatory factor (Ser/Thr protein kinase) [Streptomyces prasinopilosus]
MGEDGATPDRPALRTTVALDGEGASIARARHLAVDFLTRMRAEHGLSVSQRALDLTQLVVSELVTNARKYAPGPVLMDLRIAGGTVEVVVWDSEPALPMPRGADAERVGQHGLEIVMAVVQSLVVEREPVGKRVVARIALVDDPLDDPVGSPAEPGPV